MSWLESERASAAATRIVDAAAELYAERGVAAVGMADVARAAGCSRATLYRYFDSREALREAYVHREAQRIAVHVAEEVATVTDPQRRVVDAALAAVRIVRESPTAAAWFEPANAGIAVRAAQHSTVVTALAEAFFGGSEHTDSARWLVRIIVSLLTMPGADPHDERDMLERFVVPVLGFGVTT
ncbi:TetR/AcrR family transcriptional regulator [Rhodococcus sp. HNM0569]|uniref:TetR family transcriptional regulator n=1 Tax=Rhodococcus sp. HNM0569 TaxID=2716340 RepID=UPI00146C54AB|nr:TetR/AcrR family transcriptional regulator [Rhodococcus sp. HNM0569]